MNITKETITQFENESGLGVYIGFGLRTFTHELAEFLRLGGKLQDASSLQILGFDKETDAFINVNFNTPKNKEITTSYLFDKVDKHLNRESTYKNLRCIFERLLPSYSFYATTYGIGMDALFKSHEVVKRDAHKLHQYLTDNHIEFHNEYSDAGWVWRFVIAKTKTNIDKINALVVTKY